LVHDLNDQLTST